MNISVVLFMKNDFERLQKCLKSFRQFNYFPIIIFNCGGNYPENIDFDNISIRNIHDIWNTGYSYSFNFDWFNYFFEIGLQNDYTILFETDVLTLRKIEENDLIDFDFYGRFGKCGSSEHFLYNYFNLKDPYLHSCAGGTIFRRSYFEKCKNNLYRIEEYFNKYRNNFYQDLAATFLGRISNCSFNYWSGCNSKETSDSYENGNYSKVIHNNPIFIHPYKEF